MKCNTINKLWENACSGNIKALKEYYSKYPDGINKRYNRFNTEHSLIMGAFRNNQFETVEYLVSVGETVTDKEKENMLTELKRIEIIKLITL